MERAGVDLTITIPTFNRGPILPRTLNSIKEAIDHAPMLQCNIVISDNGSTDNTEGIVSEWANDHPETAVAYTCTEPNSGYDRNFINALEQSQGEYVWMMGDDDLLKKQALKRVAPYILYGSGHYSLINSNSSRFNQEGLTPIDRVLVPRKQSRYYQNPDHFFFDPTNGFWPFLGTYATTLCTLVLHRERALKHVQDADIEAHLGCFMIQNHIIAKMLTDHPQVAWVSKPLVGYGVFLGRPISEAAKAAGRKFNEDLLDHLLGLGYSPEGIQFMRKTQRPIGENLFNVNMPSRPPYLGNKIKWALTSKSWYRKHILGC